MSSNNEELANVTESFKKTSTNDYGSPAASDTDIAGRAGNYIFTVGNVSSGKSTIQNMLVARLWSREDVGLTWNSRGNDKKQDATLNRWVSRLMLGELPLRTDKGILQEFRIAFGQKTRRELKLNFLEISGEDIESILPSETEGKGNLGGKLDRYLSNEKIEKRFVFVSDAEANVEGRLNASGVSEDVLFSELLGYLHSSTDLSLGRLDVVLVASKWDIVSGSFSVEEYFRKFLPNTRSSLAAAQDKVMMLPFSVGKIAISENGTEQQIDSLDHRYVDALIQWVYRSFTGRELIGFPALRPGFLGRLKRRIDRLT